MQIKTIVKLIATVAVIIPLIGGVVYFVMNAENIPFESVCEKGHDKYTDLCENVNKKAFSTKNMAAINNTDYGKIIGVAWRTRNGRISSPGQRARYSESNSYYYIINSNSKKDYYFLRIVSEIDAR